MLYTKSAEYAIQALIYLAEKNSNDPIMVSEVAEAYDIPRQFLAKIAQTLVKHHLFREVLANPFGDGFQVISYAVHLGPSSPPRSWPPVRGLLSPHPALPARR